MKAYLMFPDRDFNPNVDELFGSDVLTSDFELRRLLQQGLQNGMPDPAQKPCFGHQQLSADLELSRVLKQMSGKDKIVLISCTSALFQPLLNADQISYRQNNLHDALQNRAAVRELYAITLETEKRESDSMYWLSSSYLDSTYSSAIELLKLYTEMLLKLRRVADDNMERFSSDGFHKMFTMLQEELSDEYFAQVEAMLCGLKDRNGTLISAGFGADLQGVSYVLREKEKKRFWRRWQFAPSFTIAERDDAGGKDLGCRRGRAINEATNALAQAAEHLQAFFAMLRLELAFYIGCINLADHLDQLGMPICMPRLSPLQSRDRSWERLYDISLALTKDSAVVGNQLAAKDKTLYLITGANQGGKSTFLRSIGQAQLMAQCGMFVAAEQFSTPIRSGVFSHFKKEEDSAMKSGKLDEELARMDGIADHLQRDSMVLFNESFSATNEREGSEICCQITQALVENGIEVFSVTHLYPYAAAFSGTPDTQCLCAERLKEGTRTFHVVPGSPTQSAYGEDLYRKIFAQKA
jgi:DNA mismatch repair ATPase MutS